MKAKVITTLAFFIAHNTSQEHRINKTQKRYHNVKENPQTLNTNSYYHTQHRKTAHFHHVKIILSSRGKHTQMAITPRFHHVETILPSSKHPDLLTMHGILLFQRRQPPLTINYLSPQLVEIKIYALLHEKIEK